MDLYVTVLTTVLLRPVTIVAGVALGALRPGWSVMAWGPFLVALLSEAVRLAGIGEFRIAPFFLGAALIAATLWVALGTILGWAVRRARRARRGRSATGAR